MKPIDIKHAIEKAGSNQAKIARECSVTPTQVHRVIHGSVSDHVRQAIARTIGKDVKEIWPDYYLRRSMRV